MKFDAFISYSRRDQEIVKKLCSLLDAVGVSYWIDQNGIGADDFKRVIVNAIENSELFIFVSTINSNKSTWTAKEIGIAVEEKKTIIPIRFDDSEFNKEVKFDLVNLNYYDLFHAEDKPTALGALLTAIDQKLNHKIKWDSPACKQIIEELGILIPSSPKKSSFSYYINVSFFAIVILFGISLYNRCSLDEQVIFTDVNPNDSLMISKVNEASNIISEAWNMPDKYSGYALEFTKKISKAYTIYEKAMNLTVSDSIKKQALSIWTNSQDYINRSYIQLDSLEKYYRSLPAESPADSFALRCEEIRRYTNNKKQ